MKDKNNKDNKVINVFLSTKNILCNYSFSSIRSKLKDKYGKDRLILVNQETASDSIKNIKELITIDSNIVIITNYAYFSGDRTSLLSALIFFAKIKKNYQVSFLLDEAKSFVNSFHQKMLIKRPVARNFGRPLAGNNTIALNRGKSRVISITVW